MKQIYNSETKIQLSDDGVPMQIIQITPMWSEMEPEPNAPARFTGNSMITIMGPNGRPAGQRPFTFPIEADNLQEAFAKFLDAGEAALKEFQKQMHDEQPRILTPGQGG